MLRRIAVLTAVALGLSLSACATQNQEWHRSCTVQGKDTLYSHSEGTSRRTNRVSTSCGSFNVDDAWEAGSFNSWDLWAGLEVGKVYDIKTGGYRTGWADMFPTVLEVKPVAGPR